MNNAAADTSYFNVLYKRSRDITEAARGRGRGYFKRFSRLSREQHFYRLRKTHRNIESHLSRYAISADGLLCPLLPYLGTILSEKNDLDFSQGHPVVKACRTETRTHGRATTLGYTTNAYVSRRARGYARGQNYGSVYVHLCMYIHIYVYTYIRIYICTYIYKEKDA